MLQANTGDDMQVDMATIMQALSKLARVSVNREAHIPSKPKSKRRPKKKAKATCMCTQDMDLSRPSASQEVVFSSGGGGGGGGPFAVYKGDALSAVPCVMRDQAKPAHRFVRLASSGLGSSGCAVLVPTSVTRDCVGDKDVLKSATTIRVSRCGTSFTAFVKADKCWVLKDARTC